MDKNANGQKWHFQSERNSIINKIHWTIIYRRDSIEFRLIKNCSLSKESNEIETKCREEFYRKLLRVNENKMVS